MYTIRCFSAQPLQRVFIDRFSMVRIYCELRSFRPGIKKRPPTSLANVPAKPFGLRAPPLPARNGDEEARKERLILDFIAKSLMAEVGFVPCSSLINSMPVDLRSIIHDRYHGSLQNFIELKGAEQDLHVVGSTHIGKGQEAAHDRHGVPSKRGPHFRFCEVCQLEVPARSWYIHAYGKQHSTNSFNLRKNSLRDAIEKEKEHQQSKINDVIATAKIAPSDTERTIGPPPAGTVLQDKHVWCTVCLAPVCNAIDGWNQHARGSKHQEGLWKIKAALMRKAGVPSRPLQVQAKKRGSLKIDE